MLRDGDAVGAPDYVSDAIAGLVELNRPDLLFLWARPPGLALQTSTRSLGLFSEHVIPRFNTTVA